MNSLRILALAALALLPVATPAVAQTAAEIILRLDRAEAENRRLTGEVERMGNQIRRLDDQLQRFQKDVDFRFKEQGGSAAANPAPAAKTQRKSDTSRSDAFDPGQNPGAAGAPRQLGAGSADPGNAALPEPGSPASLNPADRPPNSPASTAAGGTARGDYDIARALLERGDHEAAELAFRDFLKKYQKDRLKPDALIGLGETFYRRNRYREAAEQYLQVTTDFAKTGRAAEAMLKLGMSLRGLGATPEACGTYSEVTKKYPNAPASIRQAVDREKKRAQCAA